MAESSTSSSKTFTGYTFEGLIVIHPVVIGELATGNLRKREETLKYLLNLPLVETATFEECLEFTSRHRLYGCGIGWSDIQLLASAKLSTSLLWTEEKRLHTIAQNLHLAFTQQI